MRQKYLMMQLVHDTPDEFGRLGVRGLLKGQTVKLHKIERKGEVPYAHITYFEDKWSASYAMEETKELDHTVPAIYLYLAGEKLQKLNFYISVKDEFDIVEMGNMFELSLEELQEKHRGTIAGKKFGL